MEELFPNTITKSPEVIVNKVFCSVSSCFHLVNCKLLEPTYLSDLKCNQECKFFCISLAFQKTNAKSLDRKTFSDQGLSAAPRFLKTIYFDLAPIINLYAVGKLVLTIFSEKKLYIEKK